VFSAGMKNKIKNIENEYMRVWNLGAMEGLNPI
jgi:hypothetical protein